MSKEDLLKNVFFQFISHTTAEIDYSQGVRLALTGGCKWIQLRMKDATDQEMLPIALHVQQMCRQARATFIIDDRVEMAQAIHADGVHLGKNDMPVSEARQILGKDFIIGGTANTYEDVKRLALDGVDYIGCGPFRFTTTKERLSPVLGVEGYRSIMAQMKAQGIQVPIVAIGGITTADIPDVMQTGVDGIALSGSILRAENPVAETTKMIKEIITWIS